MKILITGATGYLGTVLAEVLARAGHEITSFVMPGDDVRAVERFGRVAYGDVTDMVSLEAGATGYDLVIHLAGVVDITAGNRDLMRRVNVGGTTNVARLCLEHHMKMLYCSSVHAIPVLPAGQTMRETTYFHPRLVKGVYGKTKAEATAQVLSYVHDDGLDAMIAFPSGLIGPAERRPSNIGQLIRDFLTGQLTAYTTGGYNFVDVRDVADGIASMINHWQQGECYILSGYEISLDELMREIALASGKPMPRTRLPYWFAYGTSYLAELYYRIRRMKPLYTHYSVQTLKANASFSNAKAREALGFAPRALHASLADMTHWVMSHFVVRKGKKYVATEYV